MSQDEIPSGEMKYSFKAHVQAHGFGGDLIISSTTVNELVKSIKLLERAGITPTISTQHAASTPVCPVHQRPMKASKRPGSFYCSAKIGDDYCTEKARV
jgi:hypothetical protein